MDIATLIGQFGGFFWMIIAFVVALSVIVAIHEYGHYIVARWIGIHADVFSLGFGPILYSRFDKRGTKWQIAALPFGGYVKFAGDSNAASGVDGEAMAEVATSAIASPSTPEAAFESPANFTYPPNGKAAICHLVPRLSNREYSIGPKPRLNTSA